MYLSLVTFLLFVQIDFKWNTSTKLCYGIVVINGMVDAWLFGYAERVSFAFRQTDIVKSRYKSGQQCCSSWRFSIETIA